MSLPALLPSVMKRSTTPAFNKGNSSFDTNTNTYVCSFPRDKKIEVPNQVESFMQDKLCKIIMGHPSTQKIPKNIMEHFVDGYVQSLPFMTEKEVKKPCIIAFFGMNYGDIQPAVKAAWDLLNSEKKRKPRKKSRCTEYK